MLSMPELLSYLVELIKYIFLGAIQGLTEVLPVSSSGHVAIFQFILNVNADEGLLFLTLVNFGSLLAIIYHFRKLIKRLVINFFSYVFKPESRDETDDDFHYVLKILVASIPIALCGLLFQSWINNIYKEYALIVVGIGLLITSTFLYIVRFAPNKQVNQKLSYKDALVIGLLQPFALLPGLSRSGITTSSGLLRKVSMETALCFSFMLYIPLSIGSALQFLILWITQPAGFELGFDPNFLFQYVYYAFAFVASIFATRLSLKYIFKWFRQGKLIYFAIYTMAIGIIALVAGVLTY